MPLSYTLDWANRPTLRTTIRASPLATPARRPCQWVCVVERPNVPSHQLASSKYIWSNALNVFHRAMVWKVKDRPSPRWTRAVQSRTKASAWAKLWIWQLPASRSSQRRVIISLQWRIPPWHSAPHWMRCSSEMLPHQKFRIRQQLFIYKYIWYKIRNIFSAI